MLDSILLWAGAIAFGGGLIVTPWRRRASFVALAGAAMMAIALLLPVRERRASSRATRLDEIMPVWQFDEHHETHVDAPPDVVYRAMKDVRANEIALFNTLTAIRRGFRKTDENILNAGNNKPLLEVATKSGFHYLIDEPPREVVIGTDVAKGSQATMNFLITSDGSGGSNVSTETRVFAATPRARRAFSIYWRVIHPGSAIIRHMWLRAIKKRAEAQLVRMRT